MNQYHTIRQPYMIGKKGKKKKENRYKLAVEHRVSGSDEMPRIEWVNE